MVHMIDLEGKAREAGAFTGKNTVSTPRACKMKGRTKLLNPSNGLGELAFRDNSRIVLVTNGLLWQSRSRLLSLVIHMYNMLCSPQNFNMIVDRKLLSIAGCLLTIALLSVMGCANRQRSTPQSTTRAFAEAVHQGEVELAWSLLDQSLQSTISREQLETWMESEDASWLSVDTLYRLAEQAAALTAAGEIGGLHEVQWVYADGRWWVAGGRFWEPNMNTPRATLRTFVVGIDRKDWEYVRATAPPALREQLTNEILASWVSDNPDALAKMRTIASSVDSMPVEIRGDRAWIRYDDNEITFQRQESRWFIDDFR